MIKFDVDLFNAVDLNNSCAGVIHFTEKQGIMRCAGIHVFKMDVDFCATRITVQDLLIAHEVIRIIHPNIASSAVFDDCCAVGIF